MGRKRKNPEDEKLPKRVSRGKYKFYYKPTPHITIYLGSLDMSMSELWKAYDIEVGKRRDVMTFGKLWALYLKGVYYSELAPRTQSDYLQHQKKLLAVFGKVNADQVKPEHIRKFMDTRGIQSKTQANHEFASMSRVYRWGYERGYVKGNPCAGVTKFTMKPREEYIEDDEYLAIYNAGDIALKIAMEISYLCAARASDVIALSHSKISDKGIFIRQGKTGVKQIKQWSERLREIIDMAKNNFPPSPISDAVIKNSDGNKLAYKSLNTRFVDARAIASKELGKNLKCTFHDIKAKGISDFEGSSKDKQLFSGHKTENQVLVYDRKTKITPSLDIPSIKKI